MKHTRIHYSECTIFHCNITLITCLVIAWQELKADESIFGLHKINFSTFFELMPLHQ